MRFIKKLNSRVAPVQYLEAVNYFIDKELGKDIHTGREDFETVFPNLNEGMSLEEVEEKLLEIASHYTEIMNGSGTLLFYICFEKAIGFVKQEKGYAIDPYWAEGAYRAAKIDLAVYQELCKVVAENLYHRRYLPRQLKVFCSEVMSGDFPVPQKKGPAKTRDQLRNLGISECMMLLVDELGYQIESEAKEPVVQARELVHSVFQDLEFKVPGVAKPSAGRVEGIWREDTNRARYEVKMLR